MQLDLSGDFLDKEQYSKEHAKFLNEDLLHSLTSPYDFDKIRHDISRPTNPVQEILLYFVISLILSTIVICCYYTCIGENEIVPWEDVEKFLDIESDKDRYRRDRNRDRTRRLEGLQRYQN